MELTETQKQEILNAEIQSLKVQIFEHQINIAKWQAATDDWSNQIAASEKAIVDLTAAAEALTNLS
jgi:hypothetical protein